MQSPAQLLLLLLLLSFLPASAQKAKGLQTQASVEDWLQSLVFPDNDAPAQLDDLYDYYQSFLQRPLNLNKADQEDLQGLRLLSQNQIASLILYRQLFGKFLSIYELQAIPYWDKQTIRQLLPLVRVGMKGEESFAPNLRQSLFAKGNQQLFVRSSQRLHNPFPKVEGIPQQPWYMRIRSSYPKLYSLGLTLGQDSGEPWKPEGHKIPRADFTSFHATVYNQGRIKALALGDYQIQLGQSLLMAGGFQLGKGSATVAGVRRSHTGIRPYSSGSEFGFLRGMAITYRLSPTLELTAGISRQKIDARIDTVGSIPMISSIIETGYHRTPSEIARRKVLPQSVYVANLAYRHPHRPIVIGGSFASVSYPHSFHPKPFLYQSYGSTTGRQDFASVHYSYQWKQWQLFGESALQIDALPTLAHLSGIMGGLGRKVQLSLLYRYYSPRFNSPFGNALSEGSRASNEEGLYLGIRYAPSRKWQLQAYIDQFRFPWLRYRVDQPSGGHEQLLRLSHRPSRKTLFYLQYKEEKKARNLPEKAQEAIGQVRPLLKRQWQIHGKLAIPNRLSLQLRVQGSSLQTTSEAAKSTGWSIHQEISWTKGRLKLSARSQYFETDNYDARQYVYEQDVLYSYSFPAFYGRGIRQYMMAKLRLMEKVDVWIKYARTMQYPSLSKVQSIKYQLLWRF